VVKLLGSEVNTRIFALGRNYTLKKRVVNMKAILPFIFLIRCGTANAQAWKDCKPNSMVVVDLWDRVAVNRWGLVAVSH
jgi:hypothetical protein